MGWAEGLQAERVEETADRLHQQRGRQHDPPPGPSPGSVLIGYIEWELSGR